MPTTFYLLCHLIPTTQDMGTEAFSDQPGDTQLVLGEKRAGSPKPVLAALASRGCPPHTGSWALQGGRQSNMSRSKDSTQRPEKGLLRFQWNPDPRIGLVWPPMNPAQLTHGAGRDSGLSAGINKRKRVWISQVGGNFISPTFHTRKQSSVKTPVIKRRGRAAGIKTKMETLLIGKPHLTPPRHLKPLLSGTGGSAMDYWSCLSDKG